MDEESEKIAHLIGSLYHTHKKIIRQAAETLISMAPDLPDLAERLYKLLNDTPQEKRWPIAYVLAHISSPSSVCLDVLKQTLDHRDPDIRWAVALLLVRLGKNDDGTAALLFELLKTGTATQRRMVLYCLRDMDLKDTASLEAMLESLEDPEPLVRVAAVTSLKLRHEVGKHGLDSLLQLFLQDPDPRVRHTAAITMAQLGASTREIRTALEGASQSQDPQLKRVASAALDLLKKKGPTNSSKITES